MAFERSIPSFFMRLRKVFGGDRGSLQRAAITFDYPRCLFKDIEDVTLFNLFEGAVRALN